MGILGSISKAILGNRAAKRQRQKINSMEDANIGEYQGAYSDVQGMYQPAATAGNNAFGRMDRFASGNMQDFYQSPNYEWTRQEGQRGLGNSFAARGGAFSGNALRALSSFNQNLAANQVNNWWAQQGDMANMGFSATANIANGRNALARNIADANRIKAGASALEVGTKYDNYSGVASEALSLLASKFPGLGKYT